MRSKLRGSARCRLLQAGRRGRGAVGDARAGERLGQVPDGERLDVGERAVRDELGAPHEHDVRVERLDGGEQRLGGAVGAEVEEARLDAAGGLFERRVVEVLALTHEREAQGHGVAPYDVAALQVCLLTPGLPAADSPVGEHARRLADRDGVDVTIALTDGVPPGSAELAFGAARATGVADLASASFDVAIATDWMTTAHLFAVTAKRHAFWVDHLAWRRMGTWQAERFAAQLAYDLPVDFLATGEWLAAELRDLRPDARCVVDPARRRPACLLVDLDRLGARRLAARRRRDRRDRPRGRRHRAARRRRRPARRRRVVLRRAGGGGRGGSEPRRRRVGRRRADGRRHVPRAR